ncbi:transposase [Acaryochloris sp. CCMEE 5410]|uniref:transposase n=1 Tax=Acaryochloris sp. CCMEE 5410 TaxID=310037 RepID=UPI0002484E5D|nr:transposase [Acaryochloris sp. CCMEE 5410]
MLTHIKPHPLEIIPDGEASLIERVLEMYLDMMKSQDLQKRGQAPQQHALLRGTFEISASVPDKMRVGVFAKPKTFSALIYLSSSTFRDPYLRSTTRKTLSLLKKLDNHFGAIWMFIHHYNTSLQD